MHGNAAAVQARVVGYINTQALYTGMSNRQEDGSAGSTCGNDPSATAGLAAGTTVLDWPCGNSAPSGRLGEVGAGGTARAAGELDCQVHRNPCQMELVLPSPAEPLQPTSPALQRPSHQQSMASPDLRPSLPLLRHVCHDHASSPALQARTPDTAHLLADTLMWPPFSGSTSGGASATIQPAASLDSMQSLPSLARWASLSMSVSISVEGLGMPHPDADALATAIVRASDSEGGLRRCAESGGSPHSVTDRPMSPMNAESCARSAFRGRTVSSMGPDLVIGGEEWTRTLTKGGGSPRSWGQREGNVPDSPMAHSSAIDMSPQASPASHRLSGDADCSITVPEQLLGCLVSLIGGVAEKSGPIGDGAPTGDEGAHVSDTGVAAHGPPASLARKEADLFQAQAAQVAVSALAIFAEVPELAAQVRPCFAACLSAAPCSSALCAAQRDEMEGSCLSLLRCA
jgi:hypothetical protein